MSRRLPPRDADPSALSPVLDYATLLTEIKSFVREEVAHQGHTAISTSTFYSVPKERPKRFVYANLLDVINPNESDFSADEKSGEKVSGDSSDEGDAIQTEVEEAEEEVATSTDAPPVDRILQNMKRRYTWVKKDFHIEAGSFENNFPLPPAEPLSAVEYFDMFVSRSMLKAVVDESNKYYFQKHGATLKLTVKELTSVLGMFFRMGLVNMHRRCNKGFYGSQSGYQLGLGAGVVLQLCSSLPKRDDNLVVADNFFTGPQLVEELSRMGISYIGTVFLDIPGLQELSFCVAALRVNEPGVVKIGATVHLLAVSSESVSRNVEAAPAILGPTYPF
ncbi:hypothetical protein HPB51_029155 [Rhipicephalus microplus]|uniref:PiggyBac transposable element-derived protein domain-containing protein n=1 Tax=Rhipicephalus microplus TaxID=6941 RepID=A0A9J6CUX5_RHIMP|nr:hypothetical protein HPB51_029155 [Rhipicephalus microplus]